MPSTKEFTIFLASSAELKDERNDFRLFISSLNDKLVERHIYLKIVQWEKFLDAVSDTRLQEEYNAALKEADIALCLFFTKVGKYTREEFNTAYKVFKATGRPKIWTYFKNAPINTGAITDEINTLLQFKKELGHYGHFFTEYTSTADLHNKFREQLDIIIPQLILPLRKKGTIKNRKIETTSSLDLPENIATKQSLVPAAKNDKAIDDIELLLEEPTEDNIKAAIDLLGKLTRNTSTGNLILPLRSDYVQYKQDKLAGFNINGRLNVLLMRLTGIIKEYKNLNN